MNPLYQTFSVVMGERNPNFQLSAAGLLNKWRLAA